MCVRTQHEAAGTRPAWSAVKSQAVFKSQDKKKGREEGEGEEKEKDSGGGAGPGGTGL